MPNLLLTSVGRRVELTRLFHRAFDTLDLDGKLIATDIDPLAPALQTVDRAYAVPPVSDPGYSEVITEICRCEEIDLVLPLNDMDVPVLAAAKAVIEATGARLAVVDPEAACVCHDKWQAFEFFTRIGLPTPRSWLPNEVDPTQLPYPLFLKPRHGSAAENTFKIENTDQLAVLVSSVPQPIIQEFLPGSEVTTDIVCDLDGHVIATVSRRRIAVRGGEVVKGVTVLDPEIQAAARRIAEELPAVGPITAQCIFREDKPYFIEINGRVGGGLPLAVAAGIDVPAILLSLASGWPVQHLVENGYEVGMYMTRCDESFFLSEDERAQVASDRFRSG